MSDKRLSDEPDDTEITGEWADDLSYDDEDEDEEDDDGGGGHGGRTDNHHMNMAADGVRVRRSRANHRAECDQSDCDFFHDSYTHATRAAARRHAAAKGHTVILVTEQTATYEPDADPIPLVPE